MGLIWTLKLKGRAIPRHLLGILRTPVSGRCADPALVFLVNRYLVGLLRRTEREPLIFGGPRITSIPHGTTHLFGVLELFDTQGFQLAIEHGLGALDLPSFSHMI